MKLQADRGSDVSQCCDGDDDGDDDGSDVASRPPGQVRTAMKGVM